MTNSRFAFIRGIAVLVVIALAICSPLLSPPTKTDVRADLMSPPQPRYVATIDWPRPEIRIERLLNIDEFNGLDLDIASLLKREQERQQETKNQTGAIYQEVASVARVSKGGDIQ